MRCNRKGHLARLRVWNRCTTMWRMPNFQSHAIHLSKIFHFSLCMIKSCRVSTENEGFWQEIKGAHSGKQQGREAAKLLQTSGWEAEGIFIHPANIDFCLCCSFHQCFKLPPLHPQTPPPLHAPLLAQGRQCPGWFYKSRTPKSWCGSLTFNYSLQWPLCSIVPSHHLKRFFYQSQTLR